MKPSCIYPFTHVFVESTGIVKPCCNWNSKDRNWPSIKDGIHKAVHHERFRKTRELFLSGKLDPEGCHRCIKTEAQLPEGGSPRKARNKIEEKYITDMKFDPDTHRLHYLETGISSLCNLTCRMCFSHVSSSIHKIEKPGAKIKMAYMDDLKQIDIPYENLHEVKLVGGEPFYDPRHVDFLEDIISASKNKITIRYFTNGTIVPNEKILNFWKKLDKVILTLSLDGVEEVAMKQRPGPYVWQDIVDNVEYFKSISKEYNIHFAISCTMSRINVQQHQRLIDWAQETFKDHKLLSFSAFTLSVPNYLAVENAPDTEKEDILKSANAWNVREGSEQRWKDCVKLHSEHVKDKLKIKRLEGPLTHQIAPSTREEVMKKLDEHLNTDFENEYWNTWRNNG